MEGIAAWEHTLKAQGDGFKPSRVLEEIRVEREGGFGVRCG